MEELNKMCVNCPKKQSEYISLLNKKPLCNECGSAYTCISKKELKTF